MISPSTFEAYRVEAEGWTFDGSIAALAVISDVVTEMSDVRCVGEISCMRVFLRFVL